MLVAAHFVMEASMPPIHLFNEFDATLCPQWQVKVHDPW
jgi:hypothetical protein